MHPIYTGDLTQTGLMWECPDFFPLGERHVLVVSVLDDDRTPYPLYFSGDYAGHKLVPAHTGRPDYGESFYAPQTLRDARGRRIMWGWLREALDAEAQMAADWSGVMSLPRILSLHPDGTLLMRPAPELEMLRDRRFRLLGAPLAASSSLRLPVRGDTLEIVLELDPGDATAAGIAVRCAPDRSEQTLIYYDLEKQELVVDNSASSTSSDALGRLHAGPLALAKGEPLRLHIFIDRSVLEVFGNDRVCIADRVYPSREDSLGLELFASGGTASLVALDVWEMASIWDG
jgi:beta-fructofuranosidase